MAFLIQVSIANQNEVVKENKGSKFYATRMIINSWENENSDEIKVVYRN